MKAALGDKLCQQYDALLTQSSQGSIIDTEKAASYVDAVVKRYTLLNSSQPSTKAVQEKKAAYLPRIKAHAAEMILASFSKPVEVSTRLSAVGYAPESIDQLIKAMGQPGAADDAAALLSCLLTSESSCIAAAASDPGYHHHHHHHHHGHHW